MRFRLGDSHEYLSHLGFNQHDIHVLLCKHGADAEVEERWDQHELQVEMSVVGQGYLEGNIGMFTHAELRKARLASTPPKAPGNASFLFYVFLDPKNCDALVGDLEERYKLIHKKFGARRANFWYWTQTVTSLAPIFWQALKRGTKALTGVAALVELYRKIRS